ncbi:hypothetical protein IDJ81_00465 [Tsuneonella flava]|uniref:Uncharacterized protein n=1 Tax=Tsuneonella flava TaxID=2055955 RepID=A0ABX7K8W7_9SPHN|nr:hypothetical protein [Tsuneonella flava]QSB44708.1 hypothetical protein IDJ81_00465 [Tsuneonella flava]
MASPVTAPLRAHHSPVILPMACGQKPPEGPAMKAIVEVEDWRDAGRH